MTSDDQVTIINFLNRNKGRFFTVKQISTKLKMNNTISLCRKLKILNKWNRVKIIKKKTNAKIGRPSHYYGIIKNINNKNAK